MFRDKYPRKYVIKFWPEGRVKVKNIEKIRKYHDTYDDKKDVIDNQSFSDLTLDSFFCNMDRTYSTAGQSILYSLFRKPVRDKNELKRRGEFIDYYLKQEEDRIDIQEILYKLGIDRDNSFIDLINTQLKKDIFMKIFYMIFGRILPLLAIILGIVVNPVYFWGILIIAVINALICNIKRNKTENEMEENILFGIGYSAAIIRAAKRINKLDVENLNYYKVRINKILNKIGSDQKKFTVVEKLLGIDGQDGLMHEIFDGFCVVTLHLENTYQSMACNIDKYKDELRELYEIIGEIDALISVSAYKEDCEYLYSVPEFVDDSYGIEIVNGAHPLVKDVVKNSIHITDKGIVLTGTNMSGKSTFLRMLGINIMLAQSFNFVHADKYKAPFLNIVTSISPEDDVENGKSYYLAEAEAVLRILKALDSDIKVFCAIDEIFRGTNPIERIAASEEILKYIQKRNSISIVATHDKELTELLRETHKFYHFSEDVSEKEGLSFDYKLKEGILKTRNAIKLLKYVGYPDEIIEGAYRAIDKIEK
ncbi:MAG: MutS-related protein [Sarcina sp.]